MLPDRVSNPGPLTYESGALPIALRGPAYPSITSVPNAIYQISTKSAQYFQRRALKVFTMNRHGSHVGHVTWVV